MPDEPRSFTGRVNLSHIIPGHVLYALAVYVVGPYMLHAILQERMATLPALALVAVVPLAGLFYDLSRQRGINLIALASFLVIGWIFASSYLSVNAALLAMLRFAVPALISGFVCILSRFFSKPIWFYMDRFINTENIEPQKREYAEYWHNSLEYRAMVQRLNRTWGWGLIGDAIVSVLLFFVLPSNWYVLMLPLLIAITLLILVLWSVQYRNERAPYWRQVHPGKVQ